MTKVSKVQNLRCPEDYTRTLQAVMMPGCSHVFREKIIKSLFPDLIPGQALQVQRNSIGCDISSKANNGSDEILVQRMFVPALLAMSTFSRGGCSI